MDRFESNPGRDEYMKNELIIYRRHLNWLFGLASIVFAGNVILEMRFWGLSGAWFPLLGLLIALFQFIKPMMVLSDKNIKTRGIADPYFRVRMWSDIYMVKIRNSGDPKKAVLSIYNDTHSYGQYKMHPDDLKRAIEFIATKLPPEKLVLEEKSY